VDFNDSAAEAAFRIEVRAWLDANAPKRIRGSGREQVMKMADAKAWQAKKADAGYACLTWPREWGGGGRSSIEQVIFGREEAELGLDYAYFTIGLGMCVPTVIAFADDATKTRFVRPAVRGDEVWCQLFSEPGAGSDVAASRTRAVRDGDDWVLNGQKVWTSGAHYSDFGVVLVRTDPEAPKHKGLTMFWVDMRAPGIDVRPIRQATGESDFNEVYFADVRVKDSQRLGEIGRGWNVALVTLMNERSAVGGGSGPGWTELLALARELPGPTGRGRAMDDGGFRDRLVEWYLQAEGLRLTRLRSLTALSRGQTPGPEASIGKVVSARLSQEVASEALDRLDQAGIVAETASSLITVVFQSSWFWGGAMRIAGGTDEILRNIIAERVLGLPGEIRADRDVAFKDLPQGL
jgi:alkylation response protein AidB-like acyl-CoA dehydrogenase